MLKLIEIENVFPLVHEELIICEDITSRGTLAELSSRKVRFASITPNKMFYLVRFYVSILGHDREGF